MNLQKIAEVFVKPLTSERARAALESETAAVAQAKRRYAENENAETERVLEKAKARRDLAADRLDGVVVLEAEAASSAAAAKRAGQTRRLEELLKSTTTEGLIAALAPQRDRLLAIEREIAVELVPAMVAEIGRNDALVREAQAIARELGVEIPDRAGFGQTNLLGMMGRAIAVAQQEEGRRVDVSCWIARSA